MRPRYLLCTKPELLLFDEIEPLLVAQEARFEKFKQATETVIMNLKQARTSSTVPNATSDGVSNTAASPLVQLTQNTGFEQQYSGIHNSHYRGRGGRYGGRGGHNNLQCYVCYKSGHSASVCYHRFNANYVPLSPQQPYQQQSSQ